VCGIAGIVTWDGPDIAVADIDAMVHALRHRGPDGIGRQVRGGVGIGHTRLAVIDPAGGAQPMESPDGRVSITYNGELYNFRELRDELGARGHRFETQCDTEVVLAAWLRWGASCVDRFRGMFAFGLVDRRRRKLFLARDHVGIKPLVYYQTPRELCFASELQALKTRSSFPSEIDVNALDQYLALSYIPAPLTAYRGVFKLPPAHRLSVDLDSGRTRGPERYWKVRFETKRRRSPDDWMHELEEMLRESVRAHLVSDVPVGAFLSGGVDSSLIVSLMARETSAPIRTFSIGFEEEAFDETSFARTASEVWQTKHHERVVTPATLEVLPDLVGHYGEPFGDWSAVPTYYLSQLAREHVPVVISGDGGDECFAGYDRYKQVQPRDWLKRIAGPFRFGPPGPRAGSEADWARYSMMVLRAPSRAKLWRPELAGALAAPPETLRRSCKETSQWNPLARAQWVDILTYLPGAILTKVDVASMMHGLEVRTPFADRRVIEFAATIPPELLMRPLDRDRSEGKHLVKQILRKFFPEEFVARPKRGFIPPVADWFAVDGAHGTDTADRLLRPDAKIRDYFRGEAIKSLIEDLTRGGPAEPVWLLLFLEAWLDAAPSAGH